MIIWKAPIAAGKRSLQEPKGIIPALSTPVDEKGELDEDGLRSLVSNNIRWKAHGLAVSMIAGEFYKFVDDERKRCFDLVVDEADGKTPVWAGVSHLGTESVIQLGRYAKDIGAAGIIAMPALAGPQPSIAVEEHYSTILRRVDLPLMIQDADDFNGIQIRPTMYSKLAREYAHLVSVKVEGAETLQKIEEIRTMPETGRLAILGGMAGRLLFQELDLGAEGNIPGSCLTDVIVEAYENYVAGRTAIARKTYARYKRWVDFVTLHSASAMEVEKETLRLRGIIKSSHTRSPHVPLDEASKRDLATLVDSIGPVTG